MYNDMCHAMVLIIEAVSRVNFGKEVDEYEKNS